MNYKAKAESIAKLCQKAVTDLITFNAGETFEAISQARNFAKEMGLNCGSMQRDEPIALGDAKKYDYISKWRNLETQDFPNMAGVILSDDMRNGSVAVALFN